MTWIIAVGGCALLYLLVGWVITTDHSQVPRRSDVLRRMKKL